MRAIVSRPLIVALLAAAAPRALAGDLLVPSNYSTIQAAIDAASNGDRVLVDPGTYSENIDFKGKAITVKSIEGPASTIIDGGGIDSVVVFVSGETRDSVLEGFTITNGSGNSQGGGVLCLPAGRIDNGTPSSPTILGNFIVHNDAGSGAGLFSSYCAPLIANNFIFDNHASSTGGGLSIINATSDGTSPVLVNCTISRNQAPANCELSTRWIPLTVTNCIVWWNSDTDPIGGDLSNLTVSYSDVAGGFTGTGNIDVDPMLTNLEPWAGDPHLLPGSPCMDIGDNGALDLPTIDCDGDARIVGGVVDLGADERLDAPLVLGVSPNRGRHEAPTSVTLTGHRFGIGGPLTVRFGTVAATNVNVVDDAHLTCDAPPADPGPVDVGVSSTFGEGVLAAGFVYTPAVTIEGDTTIGSSITIHDLCDPGDGIFAVYGLPPAVSVPTPPFDGDLAIVPFHVYFLVATWPFDDFAVPATIPNDPALVGIDVLLQSLIGSSLTKKPREGRWTNCAVLSIK
jgi:hypothetical protein